MTSVLVLVRQALSAIAPGTHGLQHRHQALCCSSAACCAASCGRSCDSTFDDVAVSVGLYGYVQRSLFGRLCGPGVLCRSPGEMMLKVITSALAVAKCEVHPDSDFHCSVLRHCMRGCKPILCNSASTCAEPMLSALPRIASADSCKAALLCQRVCLVFCHKSRLLTSHHAQLQHRCPLAHTRTSHHADC
jgi:hypothetical protein